MKIERFFKTTSFFNIDSICLKTNSKATLKIKEGSAGAIIHVIDELDMNQTNGRKFIRKLIKEHKIDYVDRFLMGPSRSWPNLADRADAFFYLYIFFVNDKKCLYMVEDNWLLFKQWIKLL